VNVNDPNVAGESLGNSDGNRNRILAAGWRHEQALERHRGFYSAANGGYIGGAQRRTILQRQAHRIARREHGDKSLRKLSGGIFERTGPSAAWKT
jgi:hypothetical protein